MLAIRSAVNLKGIWPRRAPAVHAAGGLGAFYLFVCLFVCLFIYLFLNLAEAAASAASMQFTALYTYYRGVGRAELGGGGVQAA